MAGCAQCGETRLTDIEQMPYRRLDRASIIAFGGVDLSRPLPDQAVEAVRLLKRDTKLPLTELSVKLGWSKSGLSVNIHFHEKGKLGKRAAKRMLAAVREYRLKEGV